MEFDVEEHTRWGTQDPLGGQTPRAQEPGWELLNDLLWAVVETGRVAAAGRLGLGVGLRRGTG